jgi:hypothetical protein
LRPLGNVTQIELASFTGEGGPKTMAHGLDRLLDSIAGYRIATGQRNA